MVYAGVVAASWWLLPDRVPLHFGASGQPDRFGSRTEAVVTSALLGAGIIALFAGLARWMRRLPPAMANIPHKEYWFTPEHEPRLRRMLATDLYLFGAMTLAFLLGMEVMIIGTARSEDPSLAPWFWGWLGVFLVATLGYGVHMTRSRYRPPAS